MRAVGGADLDQACAGARHDVGHAEGAADLDQLAARDDHLAARRPARSAPAARRPALLLTAVAASAPVSRHSQRRDVVVALAAPAAVAEVVFQRGRRAHGLDRRLDRLLGQQRAAEIGVQDRAGEVEDAAARVAPEPARRRLAPAAQAASIGNVRACRAWRSAQARRASTTQRPAGTRDQAAPARAKLAMRSTDGGRKWKRFRRGRRRDTGEFLRQQGRNEASDGPEDGSAGPGDQCRPAAPKPASTGRRRPTPTRTRIRIGRCRQADQKAMTGETPSSSANSERPNSESAIEERHVDSPSSRTPPAGGEPLRPVGRAPSPARR